MGDLLGELFMLILKASVLFHFLVEYSAQNEVGKDTCIVL